MTDVTSDQPDTTIDQRAELQETLRELKEQLRGVSDPDEQTLRLLRQVREDLERVESEEDDGLLDRIEDAAVEFSSEHPVLAESLRRIVNLLNGMGI